MKITTADRFWIVLNPTPRSVMADILVNCNLHELELMILGSSLSGERLTERNLIIHTSQTGAILDAEARLAAR